MRTIVKIVFILFLLLAVVAEALAQSPRTRPRTRRLREAPIEGAIIVADVNLNGEWNSGLRFVDPFLIVNGDTIRAQFVDLLTLTGTTLNISLSDDGIPPVTVDLSPLQDDWGDQVAVVGTGLSGDGTSGNPLVNTAPDQVVTLTGGGIVTISGAYPNFTISATEVDGSVTNEIQTIGLSGNSITLTLGGGSVDLSPFLDNTDNQTLTYISTNGDLSITGGNTVTLPVFVGATGSTNGEIGLVKRPLAGEQNFFLRGDGVWANPSLGGDNWGTQSVQTDATLSGDGTPSNVLKIAQQGANEGQALIWNGTTWLPGNVTTDFMPSIDTFFLLNNVLYSSLTDDNEPAKTVDFSIYLDNTDGQTLTFTPGTLELSISGGNTVSLSGIDTDQQKIDSFILVGNLLYLSLERDGEAAKVVDLSSIQSNPQTLTWNPGANEISISNGNTIDISSVNTDNQTLVWNATTHEITITGGNVIDLTEGIQDLVGAMVSGNTETLITVSYDDALGVLNFVVNANLSQYNNDAGFITSEVDGSITNEIQTLSLASNILTLSLGGGSVNLSAYLDNTDEQTLSYNPATDEITISNGNTIDITEVNTDNQVIDVYTLVGNSLQLSISGDNEATKSVDLSAYMQSLTFNGSNGLLSISGGNSVTIPLDNQKIDTFIVAGNKLRISLERDGEAYKEVTLPSGDSYDHSPLRDTVTQSAHGFSGSNIPIPVYVDAATGNWNVSDNTIVERLHHAFVVEVIDANTFVLQTEGFFTKASHGYAIGGHYFLSSTPLSYQTQVPEGEFNDWLWTVFDANRLILKATRPYDPFADVLDTIHVANSITGDGKTPGTPLTLVNDLEAPGNSKYYGTNGTGTRGWFDLPTGAVVTVDLFQLSGMTLSISLSGDGVSPLTVDLSSVDHDLLTGFVANEHVDHSTVTLTAGIGLSGGGNILSSRSFDLDLSELTVVSVYESDDFVVMWDSGTGAEERISKADFQSAFSSGSSTLAGLSDVTITTPSSSQVLRYNGSQWVNETVTLGSSTLSGLSDVTITTPATSQFLRYNGSQWVNETVSIGTMSSWTLQANGAAGATITNGTAVSFNTTAGLSSSRSTNTIVYSLAINDLSSESSVTGTDQLLIYDVSAGTHDKAILADVAGGIAIDNLGDVVITTPSTNQVLQYNGSNWVNATLASGGMNSFTLSANTGTNQVVNDGETMTITGGEGINTVVGATNVVTVSVDINQFTTMSATVSGSSDFIAMYDTGVGNRKVTPDKLMEDIGAVPVLSTVSGTNNGTTTVNLGSKKTGIFKINMASVSTGTTMAFTNPVSAGVYTLHFYNVSGTDAVTFPTTVDKADGTDYGVSNITAGTILTMYYDGTSFFIP